MQFSLQIEEDIIDFWNIVVDEETQRPVLEHESVIFDALSLSPKIIDITGLGYTPQENSVWDGENFIDSQNKDIKPLSEKTNGMKVFAFMINNVYKFYYAIHNTEQNAMIIAALSSDPKVIVR